MKRFVRGLMAALIAAAILPAAPAYAQQTIQGITVSACGTPPNSPVVGVPNAITLDQTGVLCTAPGSSTVTIGAPLGRRADALGVSVALSTEDVALLNGAIPAGTNLIGKVGIDQTTPGTTNNVTLSTNAIASAPTVGIIQGTTTVPLSSTAAGGPTQLIALSGSTKIYVTHYELVVSGAGTFAWVYGTGVNCGTGTTYLSGASGHPMSFAANGGISSGAGLGAVMIVPSGNALCYITTGAVDTSGLVTYAQF